MIKLTVFLPTPMPIAEGWRDYTERKQCEEPIQLYVPNVKISAKAKNLAEAHYRIASVFGNDLTITRFEIEEN